MKKTKYIFIFLYLFLFSLSCEKDENNPSPTNYDMEIHNLVNQHRKSIGLSELEFNEIVWQQAYNHSKSMADAKTDFGHDGFSERINNIKEQIGTGGGGGAENVAYGYSSAQSVVDGWLNSSGHKKNIESGNNITGVSAIKDKNGTYYYTQIFYKK